MMYWIACWFLCAIVALVAAVWAEYVEYKGKLKVTVRDVGVTIYMLILGPFALLATIIFLFNRYKDIVLFTTDKRS